MQKQRSEKAIGSRIGKIATPYLLLLPFLVLYLVFFVYPALHSFALSFLNYRGYGTARFVGISNYKSLLSYSGFWKAVKNTLFYFIMHIVPTIGTGFLLAVFLQAKCVSKVQKIFKPILFLPHVIPTMATALVFRMIFSTNTGAVNQLFGLSIPWLENPDTMRWCVVLLQCWRGTGWFIVIFLAGLTSINPDVYEAATLDGANPWQRMCKITIPLMRPTFEFAFIMDAITCFKLYTEVNVLVNGAESATTDVAPMMNLVTNNMKNGSYGMAAAAGWLLFVFILCISLFESRILNRKGDAR